MASTKSRHSGGVGEAALIPLGSHAGSPPIPIKRPATVFGSRKDAVRVHLESSTVSKVHCVLVKNDWGCYLHDLGSRTHTWVNGKKVVDANLKDGDQIQIGRFQFKFSYTAGDEDEQRLAPPIELTVSTLTDPLPVSKRVLVIGRRENADLQIEDKAVSNIHAILFEHNGTFQVRDMSSRTGTWIEGKPVHQEALPPKAQLRIGPATLTYAVALPGGAVDDSIAPALFAGAAAVPLAEAPIDIDAPADEAITADALDDLLDLDIADAPATPASTSAAAPPAAPAEPEPLDLAEPDSELELEPETETEPEPVAEAPAAELDVESDAIDLELDAASDTAPSEDGLASLRRGWRSPAKPDAEAEPIELEPEPEPLAAAELAAEVSEPQVATPEPVLEAIELEPLTPEPAAAARAESDRVDAIELDLDLDDAAADDVAPVDAEALALEALAEEPPVAEVAAEPVDEVSLHVAPATPPAAAALDLEDDAMELDLSSIDLPADVAGADLDLAEEADDTNLAPPAAESIKADAPAESSLEIADEVAEDVVEAEADADESATPETVAADGAADEADRDESAAGLSLITDAEDALPLTPAEAESELAPLADAPAAPLPADAIAQPPAVAETRPAEPELSESQQDAEPDLDELKLDALELEPIELETADADLELAQPGTAEAETPAEPTIEPKAAAAAETEPSVVAAEPPVIPDVAPAELQLPEPEFEALDLDELADEVDLAEGAPVAAPTPALSDDEPADELELDLASLTPANEATVEDALADESEAAESPAPVNESAAPSIEAAADDALAGPELDLSAATFDDEAAAEDIDEAEEPTPVAELEGIDFSSLAIEPPAAEAVRPNPAPSEPSLSESAVAERVETTSDALDEFHDENATARPLINLADSIAGERAAAEMEEDAVAEDDIEVIEETRPSPESALPGPESLGEIEAELGLELDPETLVETVDETTDASEFATAFDARALADEASEDEESAVQASADETDLADDGDDEFVDESPAPAAEPQAPVQPRRHGRDPAEFVDEATIDIPEPRGGNLSDLIPSGGPLIGGTFAPSLPDMLVGGSPVVVPGADAPSTPRGTEAPGTDESDALANDRRKPLRVGFAGQPTAPASPFAAGTEGRTIADVLIGRRATQSIDVFANPSPTPEDLLLEQSDKHKDRPAPAEGTSSKTDDEIDAGLRPAATPLDDLELSGEEREILQLAQQFKPRGSIRSVQDYHQQAPAPIPPVYRAGDEPETHAALRRRRIGRVFVCLALMATLIPAALFAIQQRYAPVIKVDAMITFSGLEGLGADEARQFRVRQNEYLLSEPTRQDAVAMLDKAVPKGFLDTTMLVATTIDRDPDTRWPLNQPSLMRLRVPSRGDKENDVARLRVLAQALINANRDVREKRESLQADVSKNKAELEAKLAKRDAIKSELTALSQLGDNSLTPEQINTLQLNRKQAEDELRAVKSHRQELEAAIDRLQREVLAPATSPASGTDVAKADAELTKLNQQLADLQQQSEAVKSAVDEKNVAARKQLDTVIGQFEADLQTAQKMKDNPELAQYVEAANRHFTQTRQLTEKLLQKQEGLRTRLSELKQLVSERSEARTKDLIEKDGELKKLNDTLAIQTRQYNAAVAEGLKDEATKTELQMQLVRSLIAGREDLYKNDPIYTDTIKSLQGIIETTEAAIQDTRKEIDDTLAKAQEDFARNSPAVEKLPAEQKALAEALDKKLAAVNEARRAYDAIAENAQAEQAKLEASLKEKMAALQLEIAARRNDLSAVAAEQQAVAADSDRKQRITDTQAQLANVQQLEARTQAKLDASVKAVDDAQATLQAFRASDSKRAELELQRDDLDRDIKQINAWLSARRSEMAGLIVPDPKAELQSYDPPDRRPKFMIVAGGGLLGLLLIPLVWNLLLLSRDAHHATAAIPVGGTNGHNGHANGHTLADDDDTARGPGFDPILPDVATADAGGLAHAKVADDDVAFDEPTSESPTRNSR